MPRLAGILVDGVSVGGVETCIDLPEFKLAFDIGRCPDDAVLRPTILFTHAHMDHMGGVAWHAATRPCSIDTEASAGGPITSPAA